MSENDKKNPEESVETANEFAETTVLDEEQLDAVSTDYAATTVIPEDEVAAESDEAETLSALDEVEARAAENHENYLRALADLDNVRKRATRDVENAHRYGIEKFATELLTVLDSLEMGLKAAEDSVSVESLVAGNEATLKLFTTTMSRFNVEVIDPEGENFNPELHQALTMQPSETAEPGSVLAVVQRGYQLNGRLLRPAAVVVAKEPNPE